MSIWVIVIFVILTIVGLVMVALGLHEKTKHKDDPTGKPGKTYDILLYAGIALAVIGIIGSIWSMISYSKSKKSVQVVRGPPMGMSDFDDGPSQGYGGPPPGYGGGPPGMYGSEMSFMSQGPPPPMAPQAPQAPDIYILPNGSVYNRSTGTVTPAMPSVSSMGSFGMPSVSGMGSFGMLSQPSSYNTNSLNLEEFMKAAKLLKELKDIING